MDAKCNITGLVLQKLNNLYFGVKCLNNVDRAIIENYTESLDCGVPLDICNPANCKNEAIYFNCNFNILGLTLIVSENTLFFSVLPNNFIGGKQPFTYQWIFEEDDFTVSSSLNASQIILVLKPGKILASLVSQVAVVMIDADGCTDSKSCWITPEGLKCNQNYVPCSNTSSLTVVNSFTQCAGPQNLIVSKT